MSCGRAPPLWQMDESNPTTQMMLSLAQRTKQQPNQKHIVLVDKVKLAAAQHLQHSCHKRLGFTGFVQLALLVAVAWCFLHVKSCVPSCMQKKITS